MGKDKIDPKDKFVNAWEEGCIAKVKELNPDIVVCDMLARPGVFAANQLGIPSVLNNPAGPYSLYQTFGLEKNPNFTTQAKNRCGRIVISQTPMQWFTNLAINHYMNMRP